MQDAKPRFSDLARTARLKGPQHVTVHGRKAVVVIAAEEFPRLKSAQTGKALIQTIQSSPHRALVIEPMRSEAPVRDVVL